MSDVNSYIQDFFIQHGVQVIPLEKKAFLMTKQPALLQSRVTQQQYPNGVTSRLDVQLTVGNRTIIECFGDVGETAEAATHNNLRNFAHNSLHVFIAALQHVEADEQINVERWHIGTQKWRIYVGNYGIKSTSGMSVQLPDELFTRIEQIIQTLPLTEEYHWVRFFMSCIDDEVSHIEFLADNEVLSEAQQNLATLDWHLTPEFYSIRLFLILQKVA